ncbi:hypothetical protein SBADM41S_06283 [Streptomyces badius]
MPNSSLQNCSSSTVSEPCVCSRTPLRRASSAPWRISSVETENGEQGATAIWVIASKEASWWASIVASVAASAPSRVSTAKSGGSPPSFSLRSMEPRARVNRTPISRAAPTCTARSPEPCGKT